MISIEQNNESYEIRFPYNDVLLEYIRSVPGRRWDPNNKFWSIPQDKLGFFLNLLRGTSFESEVRIASMENLSTNQTLQSTKKTEIPNIDISDVETYVQSGQSLFEHQLDCMRFAIGRKHKGNFNGFILADSPGLGKTLEVINMALFKKKYEGAKHCLIICCINSTKYNWVNDIEKHTNGEYEGYLIGSRMKRDGSIRLNGSGKEKFEDLKTGYKFGKAEYGELPYFLILNIEALRTEDRKLKKSERSIVSNRLIELINDSQISMIALDEIHRNASPTSGQGKQLMRIKSKTGNQVEWIPMTGTPIVNKPTDVFLPLMLVNGHQSRSYYKWNQHFCIYGGYGGYQVMGYKNIPKLKEMLEPNMLRRTKEQVLDLPPKIHHVEYVENTKYQQKLYDSIRDELLLNSDSVVKALNPLSKLLRLRQVNGCPEIIDDAIDPRAKDYASKYNAKMNRLNELVSEIVSNGEKVVIFSNWVEPLRSIYRSLKKHGFRVNSYTGTMSPEDRERSKNQFIADPNIQVLIGTIAAMGTSHTLTVSSNVIFFDEPWNAATQDQAEDRCHRIGTNETLNIYSLITKDTVDEKVHNIIHQKRGTSDYIVDNNLDIRNHPELLKMLLD